MDASKIETGSFVEHNGQVYRVLSVDKHQACLIDAENKHHGCYPFDELRLVKRIKTISVWVEE